MMPSFDPLQFMLVVIGGAVMAVVVLRSIGQTSMASAFHVIEDRRTLELQRRQDNAAAEALGRLAGLEPLALNPDGSIEEAILGVAES